MKLAVVLQHASGGLVAVAQTGQGLFSCTIRGTNSPRHDVRLTFALLPYTTLDYAGADDTQRERLHRLP